MMNKDQVAAILDEIGTLLELKGESSFRCNAYHNAARTIAQLGEDLGDVVREKRLGDLPGIGDTMRQKITALVHDGKLPYYDDLRAETPPGLLEMLRVQGLGPKKVKALYEELDIDTLDKLKHACDTGAVAELKGFGEKTQHKILEGLQFLSQSGGRVRIDQALAVAEMIREEMKGCPGIARLEVCGSVRRRKETIKDIDILVSSTKPGPIMDRFVKLPGVKQVTGHGDTKSSIVIEGGRPGHTVTMNVDLRVISDKQYPFALLYFTGSKEMNIRLRARAQDRGLKLNEYELAGKDKSIACKDEADIFEALGLDYIPPELREDTGELEAAEKHQLPQLLDLDDIQGVFHCHTDWSDGKATLEEMAHAAKKLGLKYLGIGDHSQSLTVANGLSPARVRQQQKQIDALNEELSGIRLFKGTECDILADGELDFDDHLLATFDYVVASVHTHFQQTREEMTKRIVRALANPHVTMLGHATGRLLLRREGYAVDLEAVLHAAAKHHKLIEINAHPERLDLDWVHVKRAKALGVGLVINPDAHSTDQIGLYRYGVDVARRGWLEKHDVFNTRSAAQVAKALAARREG